MDNKSWLWRKKSSEKTLVANTKSDFSSKQIEEEMLPTEKEVSLERSLANLNEKLASALCESAAKDELMARHAKTVEEALTDRDKAEATAVSLKQELDKALQQKAESNERLTQLNAALKESMQQLTSVREEHEQTIHDSVMKTSREFEKAQKKLEEKLTEKSKRLSNLTVENAHLSKALLVNENLIEDLSKRTSQAEAEFNTLMARLDLVEKENAFLKYEFHMLEKELEIRNEEIEFNRQSANVSHRQHLESTKKITKLEAECQRLRILVRKRFPGPAALAKIKSEVEVVGRNQSEMRRRSLVVRDTTLQSPPDMTNKKIRFLIERLCEMDEENKNLKEILTKKDDEIHSSQIVCDQTASMLSKVEARLGELSRVQRSKDLSPTSSSGISNHSESWASALISELEHFQSQKPTTPQNKFGVSEMSLMDDFVEMEKLAIVTVGTPLGSCASSDASNALTISLEEYGGYQLDSRGKELVPVEQGRSDDIELEIQTKDVSTQDGYDWLQSVLKLILDQTRISKRSFDDLLEDIRLALTYMKTSCASDPGASDPVPISGCITWKSPNASPRGLKGELKDTESSQKELEAKLSLENDRTEALRNQLRESEQSVGYLETELRTMKESKGIIEDQIENQKLINEDLDTQHTVAKLKLNEVLQKLSSLEVELEAKSHCCEELEATCLELQLQLESVSQKEAPKETADQEERLLQTGWEITAASAKLAECQETILSLGKQLKSHQTSVFNKVSTTATNNSKLSHQRSSLLDQMLAEDNAQADKSPKTKEIISTVEAKKSSFLHLVALPEAYLDPKHESQVTFVGRRAIVSSKKRGGGVGLLRKLLLRKKRGSSKSKSKKTS
ncbi:filament-like plant protein 7 [Actinidia eriantha]|uniref:filament-like plant protein 7 n=1 Tax=Actinidia eriantha TaxID=165200 RepID=UPI002586BCF2|nr:filament-like plant protein 7 [Actinidia eriantha]XP_057488115.1 filament-like plant protein 7 [Actinidia eriantha]XP_057488116.1 filament-like plant protein 7 [Actinidia eriantha]XP_057488118.1 filament-like plant protein 7 [Actinidia eriantha]XP_057488119.1 filament-like plant protein 7 [Actinidia eriantha]